MQSWLVILKVQLTGFLFQFRPRRSEGTEEVTGFSKHPLNICGWIFSPNIYWARHYTKHFKYIILYNSDGALMKWVLQYLYFTDEKTKAQKG